MKKIFLAFLLSIFFYTYSLAIEKVYYCIETEATGFDGDEDYKQKNYKVSRFKAKIDFENNYFSSEDIFMTHTDCIYMISKWNNTMQCTAPYGAMFVINKNNLNFASAAILGIAGNNNKDDLAISHGRCEEF